MTYKAYEREDRTTRLGSMSAMTRAMSKVA
jgi:hypothetical protein